MSPWLIAVFVLVGVVYLVWSKKAGIRRVLKLGAQEGWEMLVIDSFIKLASETNETAYRVRFRDREGVLVEGILESRTFEGLVLTHSKRISKEVERGMFDVRVAMDCRKCGSLVPSGLERCPYCRSGRDELRIF